MLTGTLHLHLFGEGRTDDSLANPARMLWPLLLGLLCAGAAAQGEEPTLSKEYQLKAALLYSFTKYVEWPSKRFATADAPIVIGVMGKNPFGDELSNAVEGRKVNGHGFIVKSIYSLKEIPSLHVLFVPAGEELRAVGDTMDLIQAPAVLSVGETEQFAALGGIITFVNVVDKVRFEANLESAKRGGIKLGQPLLKLSTSGRK